MCAAKERRLSKMTPKYLADVAHGSGWPELKSSTGLRTYPMAEEDGHSSIGVNSLPTVNHIFIFIDISDVKNERLLWYRLYRFILYSHRRMNA